MMFRYRKGKFAATMAAERAEDKKLWYGWTIFGGDWYVGTVAELTKIGVIVPTPCLSMQKEAKP